MTLARRQFLLVAVALLPAVAIQAYNEFDLRRSREAEVHELALRQAQLAASELEQVFEGIHNVLATVATVPSVRALDTPACVAFMAALAPRFPHLASLAAMDLEGRIACRQEPPPGELRFADRPYFRDAVASGGFVIGEYTEGRIAKRPVLPLAMALRDEGGRTVGVVAAALDLGWLSGHLRARGLAKDGSLTVADRAGVILARDPMPERFVGTRIPDEFQRLVRASEAGTVELTSQDGTRRVLGYVPSSARPVHNVYVSAGLSAEQVYAAVERATRRGVALIAGGLALALGSAWLVGRRFLRRPMASLLAAATRWEAGDYASRTGLAGERGEFGALAAAFERMAAEVGRRQAERDRDLEALREGEERLRQLNATLEQRVAAAVAEREASEAALRQAQKMQAVGQLAGGVAHDFNNLLTAIAGNLRQLRQKAPAELAAHVDGIEQAAARGERLARQLLSFSRREPAQASAVDLRDAVRAALPLLEKAVPGGVVVTLAAGDEPCPVELDVAQLELALLNLVTNAGDAMPRGGTVRISAGRLGPGSGARAELSVADDGVGMAPEVRERAFEPFFTTKEIGKGTGLGLSGVYGFARQSGGTAVIESSPGAGAVVRLLLPLRTGAAAPDPPRSAAPRPAVPAALPRSGRAARVLVVEDDALVRMVTVDGIAEAGFEVVEAATGVEALAVLEREGHALDAVVTDVAMPGGVSGIDVARAVRGGWPRLRLVLTTGYSAETIPADGMPEGFAVVPKPFSVDELAARLRSLLATPPGGREDATAA